MTNRPPLRAVFARGVSIRVFVERLRNTTTNGTIEALDQSFHIGTGPPAWTLHFSPIAETTHVTQLSLANDYLNGRVHADGSQRQILPLRHALPFGVTPRVALSAGAQFPLAYIAQHRTNLIEAHYDRPDEFFLSFLDQVHQLYTQGHFNSDTITLEDASTRKLYRIADELRKGRGNRILDVGCGWGGATSYLANEFDVTALTLGRKSFNYTKNRLVRAGDRARVLLEDFQSHSDPLGYDGVLILGVMEHMPRYRQVLKHLRSLTRTGARIYIDCASAFSRLAINPFIRQKIWPGTHGFVDLPALLNEASRNGFKLVEVVDESLQYARTMGVWADRFVANQARISQLVGDADYRAFEMYLFGGEEALYAGKLRANHIILEAL